MMNAAHLHLALNHVPVVGILLGLVLLVYAVSAGRPQVMRVSWAIFVACGLVALAVYFSGEGAEEIVEARQGFSEALVEAHEDAGLIALIGAVVLGALAGLGLLFHRQVISTWFAGAVLLAALLTSGTMVWTANLGGQISHPEIRSTAARSLPAGTAPADALEYEAED